MNGGPNGAERPVGADEPVSAESSRSRRTGKPRTQKPRHRGVTVGAARFLDERIGGAGLLRRAMRKVFPDHFSFMFGEIALYSFLILVITGVFLTLFFEPSSREVVYRGSYAPLEGRTMSAAYESAVRLSWDVRGGLLVRQIHHWAALVFLASIVLHLCRVFFTGAFRKPRDINWIVGVTLLIAAIANGFAGYSLLDDLLSGTGVRIMFSVLQSVPVVGDTAAFWIFGGEYPGDQIINRLFVAHVLLVPTLIVGLLGIHLALIVRQRHSQFPGPGRTEHNVVGSRLWPTYAATSVPPRSAGPPRPVRGPDPEPVPRHPPPGLGLQPRPATSRGRLRRRQGPRRHGGHVRRRVRRDGPPRRGQTVPDSRHPRLPGRVRGR